MYYSMLFSHISNFVYFFKEPKKKIQRIADNNNNAVNKKKYFFVSDKQNVPLGLLNPTYIVGLIKSILFLYRRI